MQLMLTALPVVAKPPPLLLLLLSWLLLLCPLGDRPWGQQQAAARRLPSISLHQPPAPQMQSLLPQRALPHPLHCGSRPRLLRL